MYIHIMQTTGHKQAGSHPKERILTELHFLSTRWNSYINVTQLPSSFFNQAWDCLWWKNQGNQMKNCANCGNT